MLKTLSLTSQVKQHTNGFEESDLRRRLPFLYLFLTYMTLLISNNYVCPIVFIYTMH